MHKEVCNGLQEAQKDTEHLIASLKIRVPEPRDEEHAETAKTDFPMFKVTENNRFADANFWEDLATKDDDHADLVDAISQITSKVQLGPKPTQRQANATKLSKPKIASIAKMINDGKLSLPELNLPTDADYVAVWALVDSGSSVHIVNAAKVFPGAKVQPPPKGHKGFTGAGGELIKHKGFVSTNVVTAEGDTRSVVWKNGDVEMPILSTNELARNGSKLEYDEHDGVIRNKRTGKETDLYAAEGDYVAP